MTERNVISVCVNNGIGVLGRVTGLFSRRGYNIISLNVAETENLGISRMTIVADGDEGVMEQLVKQLRKLYDVSEVKVLHNAVCREHIIMKVGNGPCITSACDRDCKSFQSEGRKRSGEQAYA